MIKLKIFFLQKIDLIYSYLDNKKILKVTLFGINLCFFAFLLYCMYLAYHIDYLHLTIWNEDRHNFKGINIIIMLIEFIFYLLVNPVTRSVYIFLYLWPVIILLIIDLGYLYYKYKWYIFIQRSKIKYLFYILIWLICTLLFLHFTGYVFFIGYENNYSALPNVWLQRYYYVNFCYFIISLMILIKKLWDESDTGRKPYKKRSIDFRF